MVARFIREPTNGISHFAGILLAIAGVVWMWFDVRDPAVDYAFWPLAVFGVSMVMLFTSSTLYHSLHVPERWVRHLRRVDHMMIYIFIAGTYTPVCVLMLGGSLGIRLCIAIWILAAIGVSLKIFWMGAPRWLSVATYLGMGWVAVIFLPQVAAQITAGELAWFVAGGLFYTVGAIFYATKWPNFHRHLGFHEIWHFCVLAGCFSHFWVIRTFVAA